MVLKFGLRSSPLSDKVGVCVAQARSTGSINEEKLIKLIKEHNSTLTISDIKACLAAYDEVVIKELLKGYNLNLPLWSTGFSISGTFTDAMESLGKDNKVRITVRKGPLLRGLEDKIEVQRINVLQPNLQIKVVRDPINKTMDSLKAGGTVFAGGFNIKIDGGDAKCGLWFVDESGKETKAETFIENKPSRIIAAVPALVPGSYQVKVITQYS